MVCQKENQSLLKNFNRSIHFLEKGQDEFEAECITCDYGTSVSGANKAKLSLDMHVDSSKHKKSCPIYISLFIGIIN